MKSVLRKHSNNTVWLFATLFLLLISVFFYFSNIANAASITNYYKYNDTVLVVNDASATSTTIANYFMQARGLASTTWETTNVVHLSTSTPTNEYISRQNFTTYLRNPIQNFLISHNIASTTNYIITTKGVPLTVTGSYHASVDQELELILGKYANYMGNSLYLVNPYLNAKGKFSSIKYGFYIVTRLTAYTIPQVEHLIDHSDNATTTNSGQFVLDTVPGKGYGTGGYSIINTSMVNATTSLLAKGYSVNLDMTNAYLTYQKNVLGYYSWGSNDGHATTTHSIPHNTYVNGSIGETAVSSSARTFTYPAVYGQSLIADWIANGIDGMSGYVSEPYTIALERADILFDRYTSGYTLADSFAMASPKLNWKQVIVGDPKTTIVKTIPLAFDINTPTNNSIESQTAVTFSWMPSDSYSGDITYQLYVDGSIAVNNLTGTSTVATILPGTHTWSVKAVNSIGKTTTSISTHTINIVPGYIRGYTFYVDNLLGNDGNAGSQTSPWATLKKAGETAQAGDIVIIINNIGHPYRESLVVVKNGDKVHGDITFKGVDATHKAQIWGTTDESGGWTLATGGAPVGAYQKSLSVSNVAELLVGSDISSITLRTKSTSLASLSAGKWYFDIGTTILYYLPNSGESINNIHIEAETRAVGISSSTYNYFKDIVVRYVNGTAVSLGASDTADKVMASNSYYGFSLNGFSAHSVRLINSIATENRAYGIYLSVVSNAYVHNNLSYGNSAGLYILLRSNGTLISNNIFTDNTNNIELQLFSNPTTKFSASHNAWGGSISSIWLPYKGAGSIALSSTTSQFVSTTTNDFSPIQFSPLIDSGTAATSTTDFLGNPIYGTQDMGPIEYQPPYTMGTDQLAGNAHIRLYANGKYRYLSATSTTNTVPLTLTPKGGFTKNNYNQYLDVTISTWDSVNTFKKVFTESSSNIDAITLNTVGDMKPNAKYNVLVNGASYTTKNSNKNGVLSFTYYGGYKNSRTFTIIRVPPSFIPVIVTISNPVLATNVKAVNQRVMTQEIATTIRKTIATTTQAITNEQVIDLQRKFITLLTKFQGLLQQFVVVTE